MNFDVLIVGTGVAGLYCALNLPEYINVCIITKQKADDANSFLAQGGICVLRGEDDFNDYYEDTMKAGHYENDPKTVELVLRSSNSIIRDLIKHGVEFNLKPDGTLDYTREGAHSKPRILFHKDITGHQISSTLLKRVCEKTNIKLLEHTTMIDIIEKDNICGGVIVKDCYNNISAIKAKYTVLASGGIGGLYKNSTSLPHITGDAIALAIKHNIELKNLNYIQIHPTTLYTNKKGRKFLISESVRGEGALLLDKNGNRFTDELKPRDLVSKAIFEQMKKDNTDYVLEDMRPLGEKTILEHFPNIFKQCLSEGYDVRYEPIPVAPAEHYLMGGIKVDLASRTSMMNLYACGETSCNGIHGKNRLASNSLLESMVFAKRAADDIIFGIHENIDFDIDLKDYNIQNDNSKLILDYIERLDNNE